MWYTLLALQQRKGGIHFGNTFFADMFFFGDHRRCHRAKTRDLAGEQANYRHQYQKAAIIPKPYMIRMPHTGMRIFRVLTFAAQHLSCFVWQNINNPGVVAKW